MQKRVAGDIDRRFYGTSEVRLGQVPQDDPGKKYPNILGVAAVYFNAADPGTEYQLYEDYFERMLPGAFDRAIREKDDVRGLFNHDPNMILGRTTAGTMKLSLDHRGLLYDIDPPENQTGKFVTMAIERGDVTGSSFAFTVDSQVLRTEQRNGREVLIREIESVRLYDVSPVTYPAYEATSVTLSNRSRELLANFRSEKRSSLGYPTDLARLKRLRSLTR